MTRIYFFFSNVKILFLLHIIKTHMNYFREIKNYLYFILLIETSNYFNYNSKGNILKSTSSVSIQLLSNLEKK